MIMGRVSAEANFRVEKVKRSGSNQNESRIRQAFKGIKDMFKDTRA